MATTILATSVTSSSTTGLDYGVEAAYIYIDYSIILLTKRNSSFQYTTAMTIFNCYSQNVVWV